MSDAKLSKIFKLLDNMASEEKKPLIPLYESTDDSNTILNNLSESNFILLKKLAEKYNESPLTLIKKISGDGIKIGKEIKFNEGGTPMMNRQMEMFEDGGLKDEGGMTDSESGNDVPVGSTRKEVRDDIPAQLSEGEFVFPADVVRYIGLEKLMGIRQKAKMGLQRMEDMGQMGNSDEATMPDDMPFDETDLIIIDGDKEVEMAKGGVLMAAEGTDVKKRYTFDQLMGQNKLSFRIYKNKDGVGTTIRFVGDSPVDPIPKGFYPIDEAGNPVIPETDTSDTDTGDTDTTETPDYGGDFDGLGMVPGSVGSVQSLNMSLANQLDIIAGKEPTFIEKVISKLGIVKTLKALDKKIMGEDTTGTALSRAVDSLNIMIDNGEENTVEFNKLAGSFVDASKGYLGDTDGDGIITDEAMDRHERWIRLENEDKLMDTQRIMAWVAMIVTILSVALLLTPIIPADRMDAVSGFLNTFIVAQV